MPRAPSPNPDPNDFDLGTALLSADPAVGEQSVEACRRVLHAIQPVDVVPPNCDPLLAARVAMTLAAHLSADPYRVLFAKMPPEAMGDASGPRLGELAQALFSLETRLRADATAAHAGRVDPAVVRAGVEVRDRMERVVAYVLADGAARRHVDVAADLARLAASYATHRAALARDTIHYDPADEARARALVSQITAPRSPRVDASLGDLRNRAWSALVRCYNRLKLAGELLFMDSPEELRRFPALRNATLQLAARRRAPEEK